MSRERLITQSTDRVCVHLPLSPRRHPAERWGAPSSSMRPTVEGSSPPRAAPARSWCGTAGRSYCARCSNPPAAGPDPAPARGSPSPFGVTPPFDPASAPAFFFEIPACHRNEQMSHRYEAHVMVPADPRPRLVLRHPQVALGVLEIRLDLVPR